MDMIILLIKRTKYILYKCAFLKQMRMSVQCDKINYKEINEKNMIVSVELMIDLILGT